jgi:predicted DNA binding protein
MWSLKYTVQNTDSIYTRLTSQFNIVDYLYPVDYYLKGNKIYIFGIHLLEGEEQEKKKFIDALKRNKKVTQCEVNGDHVLTLIAEEEEWYKQLFAAELYHPAPVIIAKGKETWHVAAWNRSLLEKLIKTLEQWKEIFADFQLLSFNKTDLNEIYFPKIMPTLPDKQKKSFDLALKRGYYTWPRRVDLGDLAQEMGISASTYQEHLRKAEAKLLPFFAGNKGKSGR